LFLQYGTSELPLTQKNITNFLRRNGFSSKDAGHLAIQLDIRANILQTLIANNGGIGGNYDRILAAVLSYWLINDPRQSWVKLGEGLYHCDYARIAGLILEPEDLEELSFKWREHCDSCISKFVFTWEPH